MIIAIIGTTQDDILYFRAKMTIEREDTLFGSTIAYVGKYARADVVIVATGETNKMSAIVTSLVIAKYSPYIVISVGTASSFSPTLKQGDLFIAERVYFIDVNQLSYNSSRFGEIPNMPSFFIADSFTLKIIESVIATTTNKYLIRGSLITDDIYHTKVEEIQQVVDDNYLGESDIVAHDCSSGGVALACHLFDIPFVSVKAISYEFDNLGQLISSVRKGLEVMPSIGKIVATYIIQSKKMK